MKKNGVSLFSSLVLCLAGLAFLWAQVCVRQGLLHQPSVGLLNFEGWECVHDESPGDGCEGTALRFLEEGMGSSSATSTLPEIALPEYDCEQTRVVSARANPREESVPPLLRVDMPVAAQLMTSRHQKSARLQVEHLGRRRPCNTAWLLMLASVVVLRL